MKGVIFYKSVYGSTKQYAEWIAEETGYDLYAVASEKEIDWSKYDTIIVGSLVLMNKPFLSKWLIENWESLKHARVALFSCSGAPGGSTAIVEGYEGAVPEEIRKNISYFMFQGRMDYSKLAPMHKLMMKIGARVEKDPVVKEQMKRDMQNPVDGVSRGSIAPLVAWARNGAF